MLLFFVYEMCVMAGLACQAFYPVDAVGVRFKCTCMAGLTPGFCKLILVRQGCNINMAVGAGVVAVFYVLVIFVAAETIFGSNDTIDRNG